MTASNGIRIVVAVPFLSNGGAERALHNLASWFSTQGHHVSIIAVASQSSNPVKVAPGIKTYFLYSEDPLSRPSFIKNAKKIAALLTELQPQVVLTTSDYLNISVVLAKKITKQDFKIVVSQQYHNASYLNSLPLKNRVFIKLLQKFISKKADMIVGCSRGVAENFGKLYKLPYPSQKLAAVYNPIFEEKIIQSGAETVTIENFKKNKLNIITVGRLLDQKDHPTLIKAFSIFTASHPAASLFIIGEGPDEQKLRKQVDELSLSSKVIFLGYQQNPYSFVAKCDLFVLSSIYEGFGNVLVEAMAVGTNVVSTDCPSGPAEILEDGKFGLLAPTGNAAMLSQKMEEALKNPLPGTTLIERAKHFSIQQSGDQYLALIRTLLEKDLILQ